jgi:hypothetical protein
MRPGLAVVSVLACCAGCLERPSWLPEHYPAQVALVGEASEAEIEAAQAALKAWNAALHTELFTLVLADASACGRINLGFDDDVPADRTANTDWSTCDRYIHARRSTAGPGLITILEHELGHAMGLQHDPNPDSIMHPEVRARQPITPQDIANACAVTAACAARAAPP